MAAAATNGVTRIQITNLHGDIVGSIECGLENATLSSYSETNEYGDIANPGSRYSWLGTQERSTDALGGLFLMGARLYNPQDGAFLSPDPVPGGNVTAYTYPQDPINQDDVTGEMCFLGLGDCDMEVTNLYGHTVHVTAWRLDHIHEHGIHSNTVHRVIQRGHLDPTIRLQHPDTDRGYSYVVHEYNCNIRGCTRTGHSVRIVFIVIWGPHSRGHGELRTMYCTPRCPKWLYKDAPLS